MLNANINYANNLLHLARCYLSNEENKKTTAHCCELVARRPQFF